MKNREINLACLTLIVFLGCAFAGRAQSKTPSAVTNANVSVFTLPATGNEGHDPFFPETTRTFETKVVNNSVFEITSLKFMGVSGTAGHLFAIINNHTFTAGDDGDVTTPSGRVHLRCVQVTPTQALVEINGQLHTVRLDAK